MKNIVELENYLGVNMGCWVMLGGSKDIEKQKDKDRGNVELVVGRS